jgi:hypothetical protein
MLFCEPGFRQNIIFAFSAKHCLAKHRSANLQGTILLLSTIVIVILKIEVFTHIFPIKKKYFDPFYSFNFNRLK